MKITANSKCFEILGLNMITFCWKIVFLILVLCAVFRYHPQDLILHGDVGYGAEEQFENEAKMAVRLANFISAFLQVSSHTVYDFCLTKRCMKIQGSTNVLFVLFQISDPKEVFSGKRVADQPLTEDQMFGETLALVMGDTKIWSAGTYWERKKFTNRTLFAPFAYKESLNALKFKLEDLARLNKTGL